MRTMHTKAAVSLTTGLEDPEKVTVAFLVAVGAAESGRPTTDVPHQGGRPASPSTASPSASPARGARRWPTWSSGTPPPAGTYLVCPICVEAKGLDPDTFIEGAAPGGTVQLWEWIGDGATTFSY